MTIIWFYALYLFKVALLSEGGYVQDKLFDGKVLHPTRLTGECPGKELSMKNYFRGLRCNSTSCFIQNYTVILTEDAPEKLRNSLYITRCRSRENLDTCEEFFSQRNNDHCRMIDPDSLIASQSPFAIPYLPKLKCPIKKGTYQALNFTFDVTPFMFFNINGWYWKIRLEVFPPKADTKPVGCIIVEGYLGSK